MKVKDIVNVNNVLSQKVTIMVKGKEQLTTTFEQVARNENLLISRLYSFRIKDNVMILNI